ncbi:alpha-(1,6)-fucosyltransferase-like [Tubulanus polymorphus]|uniref:alpha-(1,6)-fucosyltransferase-like n=1 Tax=Tubulanus polymorphus TaxID=672921 RepID=UPI003DA289B2
MKSMWRVVVLLLTFWIFTVIYMNSTLFQQTPNSNSQFNEKTELRLEKALNQLDILKQQNIQLQNLATEIRDLKISSGKGQILALKKLQEKLKKTSEDLKKAEKNQQNGSSSKQTGLTEPGTDHEILLRKTDNGVTEMWFYIRSELNKIQKSSTVSGSIIDHINSILNNGADHERVIRHDIKLLRESNGAKQWRRTESKKLTELVQNRFHTLQNPKDCKTAKKVLCNLNKGCGFGCQIHHVVYCMIIAYGTGRTMILESKGWRYSTGGWEKVFQPVSETCTDKTGLLRGWGPANVISDAQVISLPIVDSLHPRPDFMPLAVPADIAPRLKRLHGDPIVWWIGQIIKYLLRPQPHLAEEMKKVKQKLGFKNPIVGVHVRRTDKVGTEAAFHSIAEYMYHVEQYFKRLDIDKGTAVDRIVYLATDDPTVLADAKNKYKEYSFISDVEISKTASLHSRYTDASLRGIILDIHLLSLCDYLVCTFSSQVCRVAYEIMQTYHPDASKYFHSLDDIYYFGGQSAHDQVAIYSHTPEKPGEIELKVGDEIGIAGNHWDGYSKGTNRRTGKLGLYPSYKVREKLYTANMADMFND